MISVNTLEYCTGARSSFVPYDNKNETLIDHILLLTEQLNYVRTCDICVDNALNVSRHRPVLCQLNIPT